MNASFPAADVERERKRALDALSVSLKNPGAIGSMVTTALLYGGAPYGIQASGTPATLARLTRDDLAEHHRRWWHPANSSLIVSGGISSAQANALAAELFGSWRGAGPVPVPPAERAGEAQRPRTIVIDMPGAGQAAVSAAVRGISRGAPDYYAMRLADAVLGGGSTGRLFEEIRTKRALSYGSYSNLVARADEGFLGATAQTKNESAAEVAQVMLGELDRLGKEPIGAEAAQKRIAFLTGNHNRSVETSGGLGNTLASLVLQGLSPGEAAAFVRNMEAVTAEQASAAAAKMVSAERATLVIVGDSAKFLDKLRAVRGDVEVIPLAELDLDSPTLRKR
jgi:zinc protease